LPKIIHFLEKPRKGREFSWTAQIFSNCFEKILRNSRSILIALDDKEAFS